VWLNRGVHKGSEVSIVKERCHKMRRVIFFCLLVLFIIPIFSFVPLRKAIKNGIRINCEVKNSLLESRIIEVSHRIEELNRYFSVIGSGSYLYRSEKIEIKLPDMRNMSGGVVSWLKIPGGTNHTYDISLSVNQPIFTGNMLSGLIRVNELRQVLNINRRAILELMLEGRIKKVFFNYRMLSKQIGSVKVLEKKIGNYLNRSEDLFREGLIEKSRLLETKLKLGDILLLEEEMENIKNSFSSIFKRLTDYDIETIEKDYIETVEDREKSIKLFMLNNPNLKILLNQKKIINLNKKINNGKNLPQIGGFAEFHYGLPGINFLSKEWSSYFQGGFNIKINVFNWGKTKKENIIGNYNIEKIDNKRKDIVRETQLRLIQLFKVLKNLKAQINIFEEMIGISKEELRLKKMMFDEKQISNKEYLDSVFNVERLDSLMEKTILRIELVKVNINIIVGKKGEK